MVLFMAKNGTFLRIRKDCDVEDRLTVTFPSKSTRGAGANCGRRNRHRQETMQCHRRLCHFENEKSTTYSFTIVFVVPLMW